jgi:hypothetical protein
VRAAPARRGGNRIAHDLGELARRLQRTRRDDGMRDAPREPFLAVLRDHRGEL